MRFVTVDGIGGIVARTTQLQKALFKSVTPSEILGTETSFLQPLKQFPIFVTPSGILGATVSFSQPKKHEAISSRPVLGRASRDMRFLHILKQENILLSPEG